MDEEIKARLDDLCERASKEQDPVRLLNLMRQINGLLDEKGKVVHEGKPSRNS